MRAHVHASRCPYEHADTRLGACVKSKDNLWRSVLSPTLYNEHFYPELPHWPGKSVSFEFPIVATAAEHVQALKATLQVLGTSHGAANETRAHIFAKIYEDCSWRHCASCHNGHGHWDVMWHCAWLFLQPSFDFPPVCTRLHLWVSLALAGTRGGALANR